MRIDFNSHALRLNATLAKSGKDLQKVDYYRTLPKLIKPSQIDEKI
ncbi:MAG: hypothetical protein ABI402_01590 [Ferruginibacter sp.]